MIDIIGNIIIANETRQKYFNACLHSLCKLKGCINSVDITIDSNEIHGKNMMVAINKCKSNYFMNFEEDHFCVCDSPLMFAELLNICEKYSVDAIRTSFHSIELECANHIENIMFENNLVKIFRMNEYNFNQFKKPYDRYYIGTNNIFNINYAKKIFSKKGIKPHNFEIRNYEYDYEYLCAVPKFEILRPIDDDHGAENTCMLKNPTNEFLELIK